mmetsp:Transcript_134965/g.234667  ORF Transcript_134965/g.234667 Transcript_134965/m.234667 type:complete len:114 (+) Transcript_134965:360-701(+)
MGPVRLLPGVDPIVGSEDKDAGVAGVVSSEITSPFADDGLDDCLAGPSCGLEEAHAGVTSRDWPSPRADGGLEILELLPLERSRPDRDGLAGLGKPLGFPSVLGDGVLIKLPI